MMWVSASAKRVVHFETNGCHSCELYVQRKCAGSSISSRRKEGAGCGGMEINGDISSYLKSNPTEYIKVLKLL